MNVKLLVLVAAVPIAAAFGIAAATIGSTTTIATPALAQNMTAGDNMTMGAGNMTTKIDIKRSGSQPSTTGPAEYFTGTVRIDPLFQANDPARAAGASVTFEPGARTAWHSHPLGQILIVTAGYGLVQQWGGLVEEIRPGDVVWIPSGEKHWHGATATTAMTHIAIQEQLDGKVVDWMEKVSDEQYQASSR
jgi:quercetin dioxygenase-like cupin family protein